MIRRIISLLLLLCMLFQFSACAGEEYHIQLFDEKNCSDVTEIYFSEPFNDRISCTDPEKIAQAVDYLQGLRFKRYHGETPEGDTSVTLVTENGEVSFVAAGNYIYFDRAYEADQDISGKLEEITGIDLGALWEEYWESME